MSPAALPLGLAPGPAATCRLLLPDTASAARRKPNPSVPCPVDQIIRELGPDLARLVRRVRGAGPADGGTVVLLTGCRRRVGCTTVALALARAAAAERDVLLIDGDLTRPGLSRQLGLSPGRGWDDALRDGGPLDEALLALLAAPQLSVLPLWQAVADPATLRSHPAFSHWRGRFRRDFDLVVLDGGPVDEGGAAWARWVDVALGVCDSASMWSADATRAWDRLDEGGAPVLGIIETWG